MNYIKIILLITLAITFSGCAQKAQMKNMTVKHLKTTTYNDKYANNIDVISVSGGQKTNPAWSSQIASDDFKKAIVASLMNAGLYEKNAQYRLKAELLKIEQPSMGFDMTVTMTVRYTLLNYKDKSIIFQKVITKPYTATVGDAFAGVKRLQMANEGSARENIYLLLKKLK